MSNKTRKDRKRHAVLGHSEGPAHLCNHLRAVALHEARADLDRGFEAVWEQNEEL